MTSKRVYIKRKNRWSEIFKISCGVSADQSLLKMNGLKYAIIKSSHFARLIKTNT